MRSTGPGLRLLPVAVVLAAVLATVACGTRGPGTSAPAASTGPGVTGTLGRSASGGTTARPARSASPGATARSSSPRVAATRATNTAAVIFGVVRAGPCPGDPVYHACRPHPLGNVEVAARSPGAGVLTSARTRADGHYSLRLRPGRYLLVVMTIRAFPGCPPVPVSAGSGAAIRADFTCAAGLRYLRPPAGNRA